MGRIHPLLAVAAIGCGSGQPAPATPPPAAAAPVTAAPAPAPEPAKVKVTRQIPEFALADVEAASQWPSRAAIRAAGELRATHDGAPIARGRGDRVLLTVSVIDPDRQSPRRRPRVLCEEHAHRVAVFVDAGDLMTTVRERALLTPTMTIAGAIEPASVGVHLAPGAELAELGPEQERGLRRASYRGAQFSATGWIDGRQLDVVYDPPPPPTAGETMDVEIVRSVDLLDAPRGAKFGRLERAGGGGIVLSARQMAPRRKGYVLVRFIDGSDAAVVGWVKASAVRPTQPAEGGIWGHGSGSGTGSSGQHVSLTRGTLLTVDDAGIVGVVTRDDEFSCAGDCDSDRPRVSVYACTSSIEVRAERAP